MSANDWLMSLDNPTNAKRKAYSLWRQGLRASDAVIIRQCYGYTERETEMLCALLDELETVANYRMNNYNPEIGF